MRSSERNMSKLPRRRRLASNGLYSVFRTLYGMICTELINIESNLWDSRNLENSSYLNSVEIQLVPNSTLHTRLYLRDILDSFLLQQPFIKPLGLFWGHLRLIPGEQANFICVTSMFMGQRSGGERVSRFRWVRVRETFIYRLVGLTCGWSVTVWGFSRR